MASKFACILRLIILYFSRDHRPARPTLERIRNPMWPFLWVYEHFFTFQAQAPLATLFPQSFQLDYGANGRRA